jgi:hypothetical protein
MMIKEPEEYPFSYIKRKKLVNLLTGAGFVFTDNSNGQHVYVANPKEGHPRIEMHYLPVAFMRRFCTKLVNTDEPFLKPYHEELRRIHLSLF